MANHRKWSEIKHKSGKKFSLLEAQDNGVFQLLVDCPLKRDEGNTGHLITIKEECVKCPHHGGTIREGQEGFDTSQEPLSENVTADEIYAAQLYVVCGYKKEETDGTSP
ncbi:MAG: hypothetical protein AAB730_00465 [Patescibacteria group bacterium]